MLLYNLPAFPEGNVDAFVAGVARSSQLVKKVDLIDVVVSLTHLFLLYSAVLWI